MRKSLSSSFDKNIILGMVENMTQEEMAWTIKMIKNKMIIINANETEVNEKPSWWNRPLTEATRSLLPKERVDLGIDYKKVLEDTLKEKYL